MKLYLVQHGKAKSEEEDPERPLNLDGIEQTKTVVKKFLNKNFDKPNVIFCSKKLRAKQTAIIMADFIKPSKGINEIDGLNPNDDPYIWLDKIEKLNEDIMIIGHLPHIKKLCALLVFKNEYNDTINFINSCIVCLEKQQEKFRFFDIILP